MKKILIYFFLIINMSSFQKMYILKKNIQTNKKSVDVFTTLPH